MTLTPTTRKEVHFKDRAVTCFEDRAKQVMEQIDGIITRFADRTAVVDERERLSYKQLSDRVDGCAAQLQKLGLSGESRVGLILSNRLEFVVSLLAIWRLGAVPVPMNVREAAPETAFILNDCGAAGLIYDPAHDAAIPAKDDVPDLKWRLDIDSIERSAPDGFDPAAPAMDEDDLACILYTSGTTGKPKGAMLTHLGIIHSMLHFAHHLELDEQDAALLVVPATHVTGLIALVMTSLGVGSKLVMQEAFNTRAVLDVTQSERISYSVMVPAMYNLILLREDLTQFDLSSLRIGAYGGAPMPVPTIEKLAELVPDLTLVNAYGATETTSPSTIMPLDADRSAFDTIGKPVACGETLIMGDDMRECPTGTVGEIWIRGPMVVAGYWNRPDATASEFVGGFWRSGDMGAMDEQGYVRIFDRIKDVVNRGGYKVFSSEVESVLMTHPDVAEAAIIAKPCAVLGERVHAVICPKSGQLDETALNALCAANLSDYKVPESYSISETPLPRNANGKVLKRTLKETFL
ncbi:class I adenylate-forming enzyme family protein [Neptunicoccus cionae]|uniref:O-succinylbenzoic acid--CoA ligase n=1 Tax=Neptunicoccus cionae TaxID=2035344 RepID=A0A916QWV9_9RHOB|nr:class I adenylate-forming enzyme family protein [Amylibacter cionae]GGA17291.1 O-succinylbenzoic acid--CoA ligase [Amylibacter cionae]